MSEKIENKIKVEIDGNVIEAEPGQMLIQVADNHGIYIPRFCYHKKLSIAANCRMCLVDIEGARKPSPACATPIMDGMKVFTKSEKTIEYQRSIMEFLLINHPLDCPICDQGGACELQDVAMGYGKDVSKFNESKIVVSDPDLGPLVSTDLTRCIKCTRCVRFGDEVAGLRELGLLSRGDDSQISTYVEKSVSSELSGNVIDICPVGALTSKPFRYKARPWELQQKSTISPHDGLGSNVYAQIRRNKVMKIVPKENEELNEVWLSDRDRFSYTALYSEDRSTKPKIKKNNVWMDVSWEEALDFVRASKDYVQKNKLEIGGVGTESASLEEMYLLQKIVRALGFNNIDTRSKQIDFRSEAFIDTGSSFSFKEIESSDCIITFGSNIQKEHPLINFRIKKAADKGSKVYNINSYSFETNYTSKQFCIESQDYKSFLMGVVSLACKSSNNAQELTSKFNDFLSDFDVSDASKEIINVLNTSVKPCIIIGSRVVSHKDYTDLVLLLNLFKKLTQVNMLALGNGSNSNGAKLAGAIPFQGANYSKVSPGGLNLKQMLNGQHKLGLMFLLNCEPEIDTLFGNTSISTLNSTDFVVSITSYETDAMREYSDVILPISTFTETPGTYVGFNGKRQSFNAIVPPLGEAKIGWKVLRVIGNYLELDGFDFMSHEDIQLEIDNIDSNIVTSAMPAFPEIDNTRVSEYNIDTQVSMYAIDNIVRRAKPLLNTIDHIDSSKVYISQDIAEKKSIKSGSIVSIYDGHKSIETKVYVNTSLSRSTILFPVGYKGKNMTFPSIEIEKVSIGD